jgi:hypothetical protein
MMNLTGWAGGVPTHWYDERIALAGRINRRLHAFGAATVAPGYAGMVPPDFAARFPGAEVREQGRWCAFSRPALLMPGSELFERIADIFYAECKKIDGAIDCHFYSVDPFHEGGVTDGIDLAAYGRQVAPEITLRIEPLDVSAHKKNTLGSTQEAIALCEAAERAGERVRLCFDTAHAILNGEDIEESIAAAGKWIEEFHLCNACITPGHALYGDRHIAPGEPGAFDIPQYQKFIAAAKVHCPDARVFTEYMCPDGMSGEEMVALHAQIVSESNVMVRRK